MSVTSRVLRCVSDVHGVNDNRRPCIAKSLAFLNTAASTSTKLFVGRSLTNQLTKC